MATGGTPQHTLKGTAFGTPLEATVQDASGNPVPGVTVTFNAGSASGASGTFANGTTTTTATTNAFGQATSSTFTSNTTAGGPYLVEASVSSGPLPAGFWLTNDPMVPIVIVATGGTPQSTRISSSFVTQLQATVKDNNGAGVPGITVTFNVPSGRASGSFAARVNSPSGANTAVTDANGVATSSYFTANKSVGTYKVTASIGGLATTADYFLTNTAGLPAVVMATGGTPQNTRVGTAFGTPLQATVLDAGGNPVANFSVIFAASTSGPSGTFANGLESMFATTNELGIATASVFTADTTVGGPYAVNASVGLGPTADFLLTNLNGLPATIAAMAGTPQTASVNTDFNTPLQVGVHDSNGTAVPGVTVTFRLPAGRANASFAGGAFTAVTDENGVATSAALTANSSVGSYVVTATVAGVPALARFTLTNTPGAPAAVMATEGTPQIALVGTALATLLQASVQDAGGNPVVGVPVTFQAPGAGASGTFANGTVAMTATTNALGIATASLFTANGTVGNYTVTASVNGVASTTAYILTSVAKALATITATGGTPQSTSVQTTFGSTLQATVKDGTGNPVPGVIVTFNLPTGRTSGSFASGVNSALTDANGIATSAVFTANANTGTYTVTATVQGVTTVASFTLTNTP
jgi:hypothetical protein